MARYELNPYTKEYERVDNDTLISGVSGNTTLTYSQETILVDVSGGNVAITMPPVVAGKVYFIKVETGGTAPSGSYYTLTLNRSGTDTIAGATSYVLSREGEYVGLVGDNSGDWGIYTSNDPDVPYGSCYGNEIGWSQASAAQNTWYDISDSDIADGQLKDVSHDGNGQLTIRQAGKYLVNYSTDGNCSLPNKHIQFGIAVNGAEANDGITHIELSSSTAEIPASGTAILSLSANDTVNLALRTTDTGSPTINVDHYNLTLVMIGR